MNESRELLAVASKHGLKCWVRARRLLDADMIELDSSVDAKSVLALLPMLGCSMYCAPVEQDDITSRDTVGRTPPESSRFDRLLPSTRQEPFAPLCIWTEVSAKFMRARHELQPAVLTVQVMQWNPARDVIERHIAAHHALFVVLEILQRKGARYKLHSEQTVKQQGRASHAAGLTMTCAHSCDEPVALAGRNGSPKTEGMLLRKKR